MTNPPKDDSKTQQDEELNRFFSRRVANQIRVILDLWGQINEEGWTLIRLDSFTEANEKLIRYAKHFQEREHLSLATKISALLETAVESKGLPSGNIMRELSDTVHQLSQQVLRHTDLEQGIQPVIITQKPVYIALSDEKAAVKLLLQLEFFGFRAMVCKDEASFRKEMLKRKPAVIIMDVDFTGKMHFGIELLTLFQSKAKKAYPVIFWTADSDDIFTRLKATRAGSHYFHSGILDTSTVIEEIEFITQVSPATPYRVLALEDSQSQAYQLELMLNQAGVICHIISDPMLLLDSLEDFQPEIIILDLYMPGCTGIELAKVIRQQEKYLNIPILFLSTEENVEVRKEALRMGGDEYFVKPVKFDVISTAVKTRCERARKLKGLLQKDSLTGLLNHTTILNELQEAIHKAQKRNSPLCFAMLDIDHFKNINDSYGHPVGDKVIKSLSLFLKQRLRKSDPIGRYGGEEYAVVLNNIELKNAIKIFEDIRLRFSQFQHQSHEGEFQATFSCGLVQLSDKNASQLTVLADQALYNAKKDGRNRVAWLEENALSKTVD